MSDDNNKQKPLTEGQLIVKGTSKLAVGWIATAAMAPILGPFAVIPFIATLAWACKKDKSENP